MTTNFVYVNKLSIARQASKVNMRTTTIDPFGKPIGNQNQVTINNLGPQNFIPSPEFRFEVLRDPSCKLVKIILEEPGFLSSTEYGIVVFDISSFKPDILTPCEFDIVNSQREIVGRIGCKVFIPGVNYYRKKFYPYALSNEFNITRVHFYREIYSKNFFDEGELTNKYLGGMIQQVIQFCNTNNSILYPIDIDTDFESNTPAIIVTVKFRKNFIDEAKQNYKFVPNSCCFKLKELSYYCNSKVVLESISENKSVGLQAKVFQRVNITGAQSLEFHHQNKMDGLFFIEKFRDQITVVSKDIGLRQHANYGFTSSPGHSFLIIWYYVNDVDQQKPKVQSFNGNNNVVSKEIQGNSSMKQSNDEKIETSSTEKLNEKDSSSSGGTLYPDPDLNPVVDFSLVDEKKVEQKKVQSFE